MSINKNILLTIDLEEFDLPLEYGSCLTFNEQIDIANQGLEKLNILLEKYNIRATFFVTSIYAQANPSIIRQIASRHEIASHSYSHNDILFKNPDKSKHFLEEISQVKVTGFRMPRLGAVNYRELKRSGYLYDSSVNPTYIPGRYNNLCKPRILFKDAATGFEIIPVSVSPVLRFPLFWLSFKNMPFKVYSYLCKQTLLKDKYLHLYFHAWEFADISSLKIPFYIKKLNGNAYSIRFERLVNFLKEQGEFLTISEFLEKSR